MTQASGSYNVVTCTNLLELDPRLCAAWDGCNVAQNPFLQHGFLAALEASGSVGEARGWSPQHQLVFAGDDLVAVMPLYLKTHSYGEFIFDWAWAEAAHLHGLPYYPKLVSAIPHTPAGGERILCREGVALKDVLAPLVAALLRLCAATNASGVHVLFARKHEVEALAAHGFAPRQSCQYHFERRPGWQTFADYTQAMRAPNRKQVRRERARAQGHGLRLSFREAGEVPPSDFAALYAFYRQTVWEKGAQPYLTRAFFEGLPQQAGETVYLAMAHREDVPVAAALYFRGGKALYGRYWGAAEQLDALHFELCYYMPIAWALEHGIDRFEAGAQGEHKIKRGLLPNACHSAHLLRHPGLHAAVHDFCGREAEGVAQQLEELGQHGPFVVGPR